MCENQCLTLIYIVSDVLNWLKRLIFKSAEMFSVFWLNSLDILLSELPPSEILITVDSNPGRVAFFAELFDRSFYFIDFYKTSSVIK